MKVLTQTRDQIPNFTSTIDAPVVSLDFNHSGDDDKYVSGIEAVVSLSYRNIMQSRSLARGKATNTVGRVIDWATSTQRFYAAHGHDVPIRRYNGIKWGGRGAQGVIHLEPFFVGDMRSFEIMRTHQQEYCAIVASTIGLIENVTVIPPHKQHQPGAVSRDGIYNERDFATYCLIPHLQRYAGQGHSRMETPVQNIYADMSERDDGPQVSLDEVRT